LHQLCKLAWRPHACTMPAKRRNAPDLYSAHSSLGLERLNHCCTKWRRSIRIGPAGGRPFSPFG
jgi:hypothetical protein